MASDFEAPLPDVLARTTRALQAIHQMLAETEASLRAGRPHSPGSPPATAVADGPVGDGSPLTERMGD